MRERGAQGPEILTTASPTLTLTLRPRRARFRPVTARLRRRSAKEAFGAREGARIAAGCST